MSNTPTSNQPITPAISIPASVPAPSIPTASKFSVSPIPAFKRPVNYAAAASSKSKLSPPVVNGKDVTAVIPTSSTTPASVAAASVGGITQRKSSIESKTLNVPGVKAIPTNGVLSPAIVTPSVNPIKVSAPVSAPNPIAPKPALDIHSFFTGATSPSPVPAILPTGERRSVATYDPQTSRSSQSPLPIPSNLSHSLSGHATALSSNSQSFAPRKVPTFVPQQQNSFTNSYGLGPPSPFQQHQQHQQGAYLQQQQQQQLGGKSQAQNIPNGGQYQQQQSGPNGTPQRSGSYVGSPVMQQAQPQRNTPTNRQFATSPRLSNAGLPQPGMMGYVPQNWQQQQQQQQQTFQGYQPYYPGMQQNYSGVPPSFIPSLQASAPQTSLTPSGTSSPSTGIRTPNPTNTIPPSPSPVPSNVPQTPSPAYSNYSSPPQPQAPSTPLHQQQHHPFHPSLSTGPPRTPSSPFTSLSGTAAFASEFRPNVEAASFSPSPRKSAAIKIVNPKKKAEEDAAAAAIVAANPPIIDEKESAVKVESEKKIEAEKEEASKVENEKKESEKREAEERSAAEAKAQAKAVEEAAVAKAELEKVESVKAAEVPVVDNKALEKEEVTLLAEEKVVTELSEPAQALVEARQAIQSSSASLSTASLPVSLPAKPINGAANAEDKTKRLVPEPLDLTSTKATSIPASLPSALLSARNIDNLNSISYPENIKSPRPDLNADAAPGKYRYDRDFLMQFMQVCIEKPEHLPNLEAIGMVDAGADSGMRSNFAGGASGGRRTPSMGPPAVPNRGSGAPPFGRSASTGGAFTMGSFQSPAATTSEGRFAASAPGGRAGGGGFPARAGQQMVRNSSQGGPTPSGSNFGTPGGRVKSNRGTPRGEKGNQGGGGGDRGRGDKNGHTTGDGFEDAAPLAVTDNRWTPTVIGGASAAPSTSDSPEFVQRKVKALLNKLTLEKFDSISDQILAWADKSVDEVDGRILRQVIALIFEKATDEANWSEMYARLCRKLMEKVSPNVKDETVKLPDGTAVSGGTLFRKYLLNRCQEDYESGWKQKEVAAAAAAGKAADDNAKKEANEAAKKEEESKEGATASSSAAPKEAELLSDEYYAAQKAKRRGLGLVRFIGELYRLSMLTERIMHECIKKLLANTENPEEEDVESLCRLLTTVGKGLDNLKAKQHMDIYFTRMSTIANNMKISSRIRFMTQDVLELRKEKWQPRHDSAGPKLISEIHSDAQKATEEASRRVASSSGKGLPRLQDQMGSRPNSYRGNPRNQFPGPGADGWSAPVVVRPAKAGDLSSFGKIRGDSTPASLGPTGAFANRGALAAKAKEPVRAPSNPFAALEAAEASGPSAPSGRTKLVLAPRTVKTAGGEEEEEKVEVEEPVEEEEEDDGSIDPNAISMSRAEGERRASNSVKEFFSVKNISEGVASVEALPVEYRGFLITALADAAVQKKSEDVNLTRSLFAEIVAKKVVLHNVMLEALTPLVVVLIDTSVDVPSVYTFASQLLAGAGVSTEEVNALALKMESEEEDEEEVERGRNALTAAFAKITV